MKRWAPVAAAAAVVLVAAGGFALARLGDQGGEAAAGPPEAPGPASPSALPSAMPSPPPAGSAPPDRLLVRDGDTVTGSGVVLIAPGRPVRFCAAGAVPAIYPPRPPDCARGLDLVGADPDRLTGPLSFEGTRWGTAAVTGRLSGRTLTVTAQGPAPTGSRPGTLPQKPPCAVPAGGWTEAAPSNGAISRLQAYVGAHPTEFGELVVTYPDGATSKGPDFTDTQVMLVSTVLAVPAAEARLRTVFAGNLCVRKAARSRAAVDRVWKRIGGADATAEWERHGAFMGGPDYYTGRIEVELFLLDADAAGWLRSADPDGIVDVVPSLRPVR